MRAQLSLGMCNFQVERTKVYNKELQEKVKIEFHTDEWMVERKTA